MNMFEQTHAFVSDHFIRHYTVNNNVWLLNAKNTKTMPCFGKDMI